MNADGRANPPASTAPPVSLCDTVAAQGTPMRIETVEALETQVHVSFGTPEEYEAARHDARLEVVEA